MRYDPTREALLHPEAQPPLAMDGGWSIDAIAAECSRLAYVRFEAGQPQRDLIATALQLAGYGRVAWFRDDRDLAQGKRLIAPGFGTIDAAGRAIIAFRGTQADSFRDILADARFGLVKWPGQGRVHSGFWTSLAGILPQIEAWLASLEVSRLIVTGHSLGAAKATLLAALQDKAELISFGSPRVGDAAFVASLAGRGIRRYVNCTDVVTQLPPAVGYAHVEGLHYIDHQGRVRGADDMPSLLKDHLEANRAHLACLRSTDNVQIRGLADHAPINYVSAVRGVRTGA